MHMAPIILLTSISTCTGSVLFFIGLSMFSIGRWFLNPSIIKFNRELGRYTEELDPGNSGEVEEPKEVASSHINDIDAKAYKERAQSQAKHIAKGDNSVAKKVFRGDILTITMVWTNVYGLGVASFFMSYVVTLASSLCTFSCVVSMSAVSIYEAYKERVDPIRRQWNAGRSTGKLRSGLHSTVLIISIASMCTIGAHVAGVHVNSIGYIQPEDIFLGIVGPVMTPFLLKSVRRPHTTTISTLETSLPFTVFICATFMATALALGMRPYESQNELGRNVAAATTLLPLAWGMVTFFVLHCIFRRRMLYVFSTFMTVFAGRELTMSKGSSVVLATFFLQLFAFMLTIASSNTFALDWIAGILRLEGSSTAAEQQVTIRFDETDGERL